MKRKTTLGRKGLRRETRAATNLRYRPEERAISGELRASRQRVGQQGDWWNNYLQTVNQGRAETAAAYDKAAATSQAQVAQASAIDTANTQKLNEEAAKSAATRGAETSSAPAERESAAQAQRNYLSAAQAGTTAQMGANQYAYLTDQKRIGEGQKIASRTEEQKRGLSLRQDLRDTRKERGEYAASKRGELRDKEREYVQQLKEFGLQKRQVRSEEEAAKASAAMAAREAAEGRTQRQIENAQAERGLNQAGRKIRISAQQARYERKHPGTSSEVQGKVTDYNNAKAAAKTLFESRKWKGGWPELQRVVEKQPEVSPAMARRAVAALRQHVEKKQAPQRSAQRKRRKKVVGTRILGLPTK